jgi:multimeric flavodoxin WrbA
MKIVVISYSLTGNNEALANSIAEEFAAEHIKITEPKPRTMGSIILDLIFNRTPQVQPIPERLENYDLILFFGPIWMGQVATPLRAYLKHLKTNLRRYAFISIGGGADGPNPKLAGELKKRVGTEPVALINLHIADLLPSDPKPVRKETMSYRINNGDIKKLTNIIVKTVRETIFEK